MLTIQTVLFCVYSGAYREMLHIAFTYKEQWWDWSIGREPTLQGMYIWALNFKYSFRINENQKQSKTQKLVYIFTQWILSNEDFFVIQTNQNHKEKSNHRAVISLSQNVYSHNWLFHHTNADGYTAIVSPCSVCTFPQSCQKGQTLSINTTWNYTS